MTWEIAVGFFTIISSLIAAMGVVVKVNRTLTMLDDSVKQLKIFMEKQSLKNHDFGKILSTHEIRLIRLENDKRSTGNN